MPLPVGGVIVPVTPPSVDTLPVPWTQDIGTITAIWTDPMGVDWPLSDTSEDRGYFTTDGIAGWGAAPYEIVTDPMARGGESVRYIRSQPARLTWPVHVFSPDGTHMGFVNQFRALRRAFLMTVHRQLPGTLTVYRPDGSARSIQAYYEDGWGGEAGQLWTWATVPVTLFCPDGTWQDINPTQFIWSAANAVPFDQPFLTLSAAQVLGGTTIVNPGEVVAWPVWTITGPCTSVTATNNSTGQTWTLTHTLTTGQQMTVTTDRPTVRGNSGENITSDLNWPLAYLWGLLPGENDVTFSVAGSAAATRINMSFYARYEGA